MVLTRKRASHAKTVATQTEGLLNNVAVQVSGCRECLSLLLPGEDGKDATCVRCEQLDELLNLVVELREEVGRLRTIRECEREIDWWSDSLRERRRDCTTQTEGTMDPLSHCSQTGRDSLREDEEWQLVSSRRRRQPPSSRPTSVPLIPLCNRYETLKPEGEVTDDNVGALPPSLPKVRRSAPRLKTASSKKERRVVVVGDSLLRGTEGPICRPDPTRREVCCLPAARVRDISRKLPSLIHPSDYYPLLIVQAGSDEIPVRSLRIIKNDFRRLGKLVDGAGIQVVFASIPLVAGMNAEMTRKSHLINAWMRGWCKRKNFGFFDHGVVYSASGLRSADGNCLSPKGRRILAQELAGLVERALN
ncbi:uncharacterized protein LOC122178868 [Lagopus leucura]|uniref:uncharacterized protein LOC122178868 n=1 Tax=Lagopus leucura TaxID=30410 RepID=UPI001C6675A6|nr:uncharacterized protein LOC122178868 [Lagopus leucura]